MKSYLHEGDIAAILEMNVDETWYKVVIDGEDEGWVAASVVAPVTTISAAPSDPETPSRTVEPTIGITATPTPAPSPAHTSTPFPPLYVEVHNVREQIDSDGDLWILGEVFNPGQQPAEDIELNATLYDASGGVLAVETSNADMPLSFSLWFTGVLYPGEKAPFQIRIEEPGAWDDWKLTVSYEEAKERYYDEHYRDLEILNDTGRDVNEFLGNYRVSGEIENIGTSACGPVRIMVTLYNNSGEVVGSGSELSEFDELMPGRITPFSVLVYARAPVASYAIIIRAIRAD